MPRGLQIRDVVPSPLPADAYSLSTKDVSRHSRFVVSSSFAGVFIVSMSLQILRESPWSIGRILLTLALTVSLLHSAAKAGNEDQCVTGESFSITGKCSAVAKVDTQELVLIVDDLRRLVKEEHIYPDCEPKVPILKSTTAKRFMLGIGDCNVTIVSCLHNGGPDFLAYVAGQELPTALPFLDKIKITQGKIDVYHPESKRPFTCSSTIFEKFNDGGKNAWTVKVSLSGDVPPKFSLSAKNAQVVHIPDAGNTASGMEIWKIVVIVVTVLLLLLISSSISLVLFYCLRRKQKTSEVDPEAAQQPLKTATADQSDTPDGDKKQPPPTNVKSKEDDKSKNGAEQKTQEGEAQRKQQEASKNGEPPASKNDEEKKPAKAKKEKTEDKADKTKKTRDSRSMSINSTDYDIVVTAQAMRNAQAAADAK